MRRVTLINILPRCKKSSFIHSRPYGGAYPAFAATATAQAAGNVVAQGATPVVVDSATGAISANSPTIVGSITVPSSAASVAGTSTVLCPTAAPVDAGGLSRSVSTSKWKNWKTRLCVRFTSEGTCERGVYCDFAHGSSELRTVDQNLLEDGGQRYTVFGDSLTWGLFLFFCPGVQYYSVTSKATFRNEEDDPVRRGSNS